MLNKISVEFFVSCNSVDYNAVINSQMQLMLRTFTYNEFQFMNDFVCRSIIVILFAVLAITIINSNSGE